MNGLTRFCSSVVRHRRWVASAAVLLVGFTVVAAGITVRAGAYGRHTYLDADPTLLAAGLLTIVAAVRLCGRATRSVPQRGPDNQF